MINATWFGGPNDGEMIALKSYHEPVLIPIPRKNNGIGPPPSLEEAFKPLEIEVREFRPELTRNGWILRWREQ